MERMRDREMGRWRRLAQRRDFGALSPSLFLSISALYHGRSYRSFHVATLAIPRCARRVVATSSSVPADVTIFGASHLGVRLAERLLGDARRVTLIDPVAAPAAARGWSHVQCEFAVPADIGAARVVYVVTDQDKLNIRLALAVRRVSATVPIVIALTQSRLGEKLSRHLANLAFVNPPALAAGHFVDAIYAADSADAAQLPPAPAPAETEEHPRWHPDPICINLSERLNDGV